MLLNKEAKPNISEGRDIWIHAFPKSISCIIREFIPYEFELCHNAVEATKKPLLCEWWRCSWLQHNNQIEDKISQNLWFTPVSIDHVFFLCWPCKIIFISANQVVYDVTHKLWPSSYLLTNRFYNRIRENWKEETWPWVSASLVVLA